MPNSCAAADDDFAKRYQFLRERDPEAYLERFVDETVGAVVDYCTPSMQAAIELGEEEFWTQLDDGMTPAPLVALFEEIRGPLPAEERERLTRGIRRAFIGATLDPRVSCDELLRDVWRQPGGVRARADVLAS